MFPTNHKTGETNSPERKSQAGKFEFLREELVFRDWDVLFEVWRGALGRVLCSNLGRWRWGLRRQGESILTHHHTKQWFQILTCVRPQLFSLGTQFIVLLYGLILHLDGTTETSQVMLQTRSFASICCSLCAGGVQKGAAVHFRAGFSFTRKVQKLFLVE